MGGLGGRHKAQLKVCIAAPSLSYRASFGISAIALNRWITIWHMGSLAQVSSMINEIWDKSRHALARASIRETEVGRNF